MVEAKETTDREYAIGKDMAASPTETEQRQGTSTAQPSGDEHPASEQTKKSRRLLPAIAIVAILAVAAFMLWKLVFAQPKVPENLVILSGRIEGDDSAIAPKTAGLIQEIRFREGDVVKAGEVIATLDDRQIDARERQAQAAVLQAEAQLRSAQAQIPILQDQLQQARLQTSQASTDAAGRVRQAEAEVAAAEQELAQQEASYQIAAFDRDAYTRLAKSGAVSERQGRQAASTADTQLAAVNAARRRLEAAQGSLNIARSSLANPDIRTAAAAQVQKQIIQQQSQIANAAADAQRARAQLLEAQADRHDLTVRAPFEGTVVTRSAEPGEVVQAGTAIVTMLDLSRVYLRGFVPEGQIGKVRLGQPARVFLDSNPAQPLEAYVSRVDPQATFTPENTYFRDDRVKQVVGVKLQLKNAVGYAKPGMPADGEILVSGDQWPEWRRPRK
jgi:HlyD family secretion protein